MAKHAKQKGRRKTTDAPYKPASAASTTSPLMRVAIIVAAILLIFATGGIPQLIVGAHDAAQRHAATAGSTDKTIETPDKQTDSSTPSVDISDETATTGTDQDILATWDESLAPNYVYVSGIATISHPEVQAGDGIQYGNLDELGRATGAWGRITHDDYAVAKARGRQDMPDIDLTGWTDNKETTVELYDGSSYHGWFWNRSHLVADSLGGDPIAENLVTGTRMQNVGDNSGDGGMAYCETRAREWLDTASDDQSLYYCATPYYQGNELVCRSVVVDMWSSDGTIDQRVIVYNAAKGHTIDYMTGAWE